LSLVAGLAMLACFTAERPVRGIADMAEELELGRSTTCRYATTLVTLGYLERDRSRKYRLSSRASDVGLSLLEAIRVRRVAREHLRVLRDKTGRTVSLGILDGIEVAYVDRWQGSRQGQYAIDQGIGVGTRVSVHCSAAGKALVASLPVAERLELVSELRLERHGPRTVATKKALRAELEQIATRGIAIEDEELVRGRRALAAAVVDGGGVPVAAVELATPLRTCTREQLAETLVPDVIAAAQRIASGLRPIDVSEAAS
jgi:IclR family transcriptional regulator, pca regulon regulatory protein